MHIKPLLTILLIGMLAATATAYGQQSADRQTPSGSRNAAASSAPVGRALVYVYHKKRLGGCLVAKAFVNNEYLVS